MLPVKNFISPEGLEELASRSHFRYGKEIAEEGEFTPIKINTFNIIAKVKHGTNEPWIVELMSTSKGFRYKCSCSAKKNFFCQHCVAAGLAFNK